MNEDMTDFLKVLEEETNNIDNEIEKAKAKARLEEVMYVYKGDDMLINTEDIKARIEERKDELVMQTGVGGLDDILGGLRAEQLIVLAAPTKSGKTQFCMELTLRLEDQNPLWIPFEESADELVRKYMERGVEPPNFYTPKNMTGNTVDWVEKKIVEGRVKYGTNIVFIDHLHFLIPFNTERMDTRIGHTMRALKRLAKEHGVVIVLIAHLKKTKLDIAPDLEDLRDSSFIAQEADTVMLLWRETERKNNEVVISNKTILSVQANRRTGNTGNVRMIFTNGRYLEEDWKTDEQTGICSNCGQLMETF